MAKKWRWVTRDGGAQEVIIWLGKYWRKEPTFNETFQYWNSSAEEFEICAQQFKSILGITVPTDHPIRVSFSAEILEEVTP